MEWLKKLNPFKDEEESTVASQTSQPKKIEDINLDHSKNAYRKRLLEGQATEMHLPKKDRSAILAAESRENPKGHEISLDQVDAEKASIMAEAAAFAGNYSGLSPENNEIKNYDLPALEKIKEQTLNHLELMQTLPMPTRESDEALRMAFVRDELEKLDRALEIHIQTKKDLAAEREKINQVA